MKKNILTIIIMAVVLINTVLTGVLIFVIVPTSDRTTKLVAKVASIVNLELEDPDQSDAVITVQDRETFEIPDELRINLKEGNDGIIHYALIPKVTLTVNKKNADYSDLSTTIPGNVNVIVEIITEEVGKYTFNEVNDQKENIKQAVLIRIQELFNSDFIIDISFGNMVYS